MTTIFPIVEGHGDVRAAPVLIRRILHERLEIFDCTVLGAFRLPKGRICQFGDALGAAMAGGALRIQEKGAGGGIIVLIDADDDCPARLHEQFNAFCVERNFAVPTAFVAANREYEAWFIAAASALVDTTEDVRDNAANHPDPEAVRGAKGYFERAVLRDGVVYSETIDQEKYSARVDLNAVHAMCPSFRKLSREVRRFAVSSAMGGYQAGSRTAHPSAALLRVAWRRS